MARSTAGCRYLHWPLHHFQIRFHVSRRSKGAHKTRVIHNRNPIHGGSQAFFHKHNRGYHTQHSEDVSSLADAVTIPVAFCRHGP